MKKVLVVDAIIIKKNKLLLTRRSKNEDHSGRLSFPGGVVMNKEAREVALKRELKEELGIEVNNIQHFKTYMVAVNNGVWVKAIYYICIFVGKSIRLNQEAAAYKWVSISNKLLDLNLAFNQKIVMKDFLEFWIKNNNCK